jgi:hypothetical protein
VSVHVDPITLELHFQRLEHATGFDVRALIEERDRLRELALRLVADIEGEGAWAEDLRREALA